MGIGPSGLLVADVTGDGRLGSTFVTYAGSGFWEACLSLISTRRVQAYGVWVDINSDHPSIQAKLQSDGYGN